MDKKHFAPIYSTAECAALSYYERTQLCQGNIWMVHESEEQIGHIFFYLFHLNITGLSLPLAFSLPHQWPGSFLYHLSVGTYPWTWSSSPPGTWLWLGLGDSLAVFDLASSNCFSWHFLGRDEYSTGIVLQRNLSLLPCAASMEQIQGHHVTVGFSSEKMLGRQPTQGSETEMGWGLTLCSALQRNGSTGTGGSTSNHISHQHPDLEHLPQLPFHEDSPKKAKISFSHIVLWTCWLEGWPQTC